MNPRLPFAGSSWGTLLPSAAGLTLVAFALGAQVGKPAGLWAFDRGSRTEDVDGDGLCNPLEDVLWLDGHSADSDGDGWGDAEEIARASDPKSSASVPGPHVLNVGMKGYSLDGVMHVVLAIYQKGGLGSEHSFRLGVVRNGRDFPLRPSAYLPFTDVSVVPGREAGDTVHLLDLRLPARWLIDLPEVSFYVTGAPSTASLVTTAAALNIVTVEGIPFEVAPAPGSESYPTIAATSPGPSGSSGQGTLGGTIYQPLVPRGGLPNSSTLGKVCVQTTRTVGGGGGALHLQVVAGFCQTGDGACASSCSASAGSTYELVDPLALIGG